MVVGAPSLSVMAWSSSRAGGKQLAANSLKASQWSWYCSGRSFWTSTHSESRASVVIWVAQIWVFCFWRKPAVSISTVSPFKVFLSQLNSGLNSRNQGYPRMTRSRPRLATSKPSFSVFEPCRAQRLQKWVMVPLRLIVPSTLLMVRGLRNSFVPIPRDFTVRGSMKLCVAPPCHGSPYAQPTNG